MPTCFSCNQTFPDNKELALHLTTTKDKKHRNRKSKVWAANFLNRTRALNAKRDLPGRTPLDEQDKENKKDCQRHINENETIRVVTCCPQCKRIAEEELPEAYVIDDGVHAWRKGHIFFILCINHRDKEPRTYRTKSQNFGRV